MIDRSRSQIRLTQAGKVLLARARQIIRQVTKRLPKSRNSVRQERILRIGFVGSATHGFLPSLIKTFRARHPDVELTLSAMNNAGLKEALIRREIDGAIARPAIEDDEILTEKLHEEPLIIALPDAFEREWQQPLPIASLRDATFILYPQHPRPSFADHILSVCSASGFRRTIRSWRWTIRQRSVWCRWVWAFASCRDRSPQRSMRASSTVTSSGLIRVRRCQSTIASTIVRPSFSASLGSRENSPAA